jgi:hypothetical protein
MINSKKSIIIFDFDFDFDFEAKKNFELTIYFVIIESKYWKMIIIFYLLKYLLFKNLLWNQTNLDSINLYSVLKSRLFKLTFNEDK